MMGPVAGLAGRLLVGGLAATAALGGLAILAGALPWSPTKAVLAIGVATLSWLRPLPSLTLLLAALPFFGNRPTTPQFLWFVWVTALVVLPSLVRLATTWRTETRMVLSSGVGLAALGYAGASWLSLTSVPFDEIAESHRLAFGPAGLWQALRILPSTDVLDPFYAVLTVVLTLHALVIGLAIAVLVRHDPRVLRWLGGGLLAGFVATIVAGLLDFHFLIDLRTLRAFDPFTNPAGVNRLQSTFGHSGWFAQFVCFAAPSVLVIRLWLQSRPTSVAVAVAVLATGLAAIVLSNQRGGWITYAVVTVLIVTAGTRLVLPKTALRSSSRRLVPAAASVVVLLVAGLLVAVTLWAASEGNARAIGLAERLRYISQVSDRSAHVIAGLRLGGLHPVLGGGSETFALRYQDEYLRAGGNYYARGFSPVLDLYGSAHNVFAQTFAGKGLVGVIALVAVVLAAVVRAWPTRRDATTGAIDVVVASHIVLATLVAFVLYGQVQEVFYIQPLQILIFAVVGLAAGLPAALAPNGTGSRWSPGLVALLLLVALGAHLTQAYGVPGRLGEAYRDRQISRAGSRLLPPERDRDGEYFQWTGASAFVSVPRHATRFSADVRSLAPFAQLVELRLDARVIDRLRLEDHDWKRVDYPIGRLQELPRRLEIRVQPVWQPDGDVRALGVMLRRITWGLPPRPDVP